MYQELRLSLIPKHPKAHGRETSSMMGCTGLLSSNQPTPVSSGKPKLYMFFLPAVKAVLYLNNEGNLEFMAKHREISPLHRSVLSLLQCQPPLLFRAALSTERLCKGRSPAHFIAGFSASCLALKMSRLYQLNTS